MVLLQLCKVGKDHQCLHTFPGNHSLVNFNFIGSRYLTLRLTWHMRNTEATPSQIDHQLLSVLVTVERFSVVHSCGSIIALSQRVVFKLYQVKTILP